MITITLIDKMKEREIMKRVKAMPVFTAGQVSAWLGSRAYSKVYLHRLSERGLITRLKRGFYTVHDDPVIYASHMHFPSYISLLYAFQHHGTTTQLPRKLHVMARVKGTIGNVSFIKTGSMWGYKKTRYGDFEIFIADLEKAVIDSVVTGLVPPDEIKTAIEKCDKKRLEEYALKTDIAAMKRLGYLAEEAGVFLESVHEKIRNDRNYAVFPYVSGKNRWRVKHD
jgi:predicted transcriptional regulator of viral defense system